MARRTFPANDGAERGRVDASVAREGDEERRGDKQPATTQREMSEPAARQALLPPHGTAGEVNLGLRAPGQLRRFIVVILSEQFPGVAIRDQFLPNRSD
jgi:hypothetical protein